MSANSIRFLLGDEVERVDFRQTSHHRPTTTLLQYLRSRQDRCGTKEGCAEGDCGACTVVLRELDQDGALQSRTACSCLVLLPQVAGKQVVTVEDVGCSERPSGGGPLHPVQRAMVDKGGSQCGFCTPGIVMSLLALYESDRGGERRTLEDGLSGNLCRCTGYRPIVDAATASLAERGRDEDLGARRERVRLALGALEQEGASPAVVAARGQRYHLPKTREEAVALRAAHPRAWLVAGATDLGLRLTKGHELPPHLIDLSSVSELRRVEDVPDRAALFVGASASLTDLLEACRGRHRGMVEMLEVFGSPQIRNRGTVGGNLATASPIGDTLPVLIASGATVVLYGPKGERSLPVEDFVTGYRTTALADDELIGGIYLPWPGEGEVVRAYKVSRRRDLDITTVSLAAAIQRDKDGVVRSARLAFGAMDARARRVHEAEQVLLGSPLDEERAARAADLSAASFTPLTDVRSGARLRSVAARNLVLALWRDLAEEEAGAPLAPNGEQP